MHLSIECNNSYEIFQANFEKNHGKATFHEFSSGKLERMNVFQKKNNADSTLISLPLMYKFLYEWKRLVFHNVSLE